MRISDWSSDVCSSDLPEGAGICVVEIERGVQRVHAAIVAVLHHSPAGAFSAPAFSSRTRSNIWKKTSGDWAPDTAYLPSMMKQGTPVTPRTRSEERRVGKE